jgi:hypothetical protein
VLDEIARSVVDGADAFFVGDVWHGGLRQQPDLLSVAEQ